MRASGVVLFLGFVGAAASVLGTEACIYSSNGQGGTAGAIALWGEDGGAEEGGAAGGSSGGAVGNGSGGVDNGSSSGGDNGSSSGGDNGSSSGGDGFDDASTNICPAGETPCGAAGCCGPAPDVSAPPPQCGTMDPSFLQACESYYADRNGSAFCSNCVTNAGESCSAKASSCQGATTCESSCETQLDCTGASCPPAELCNCIYDCVSPLNDVCCGPESTAFFNCASSQCTTSCPLATVEAGVP